LGTALTAPASFSLLETILRTHIAEGLFTTDDVSTPGKSVACIEGFPLTFDSIGDTIAVNKQANLVSVSSTAVGNGAIFKITALIDPFVDVFGTDVSKNGSSLAGQKSESANTISEDASPISGTIASVLASLPDLSTYTELLNATSPDFFCLLDGSFPAGKNISIFAPSNKVFEAMGGSARILQPSNHPFSSYLLKYSFLDTTSTGQEKSIAGFPATIRRGGTGAIMSVNNAVVKGEKTCVGNACVYTVDRWLDPVFGMF
jgi:uncharacterized surface protein with fasciclin (FAS1) repeats